MIRRTPLEVAEVELPSGAKVTVPTLEETLRIKAFLVTEQLGSYRRLRRRWSDWGAVGEVLGEVAAQMMSS